MCVQLTNYDFDEIDDPIVRAHIKHIWDLINATTETINAISAWSQRAIGTDKLLLQKMELLRDHIKIMEKIRVVLRDGHHN